MHTSISTRHWLLAIVALATTFFVASYNDLVNGKQPLLNSDDLSLNSSDHKVGDSSSSSELPSDSQSELPSPEYSPHFAARGPLATPQDPAVAGLEDLEVEELMERYYTASTPEISLQVLERLWSESPAIFQHDQLEFILADAQRSENDQIRRMGKLFSRDRQQIIGGGQDELSVIQARIANMQKPQVPPLKFEHQQQPSPAEDSIGSSNSDGQKPQELIESLNYLASYADDLDTRMRSLDVLRGIDTEQTILAIEGNLVSSRIPEERQRLVEFVSSMVGDTTTERLRNLMEIAVIDPDELVSTAAAGALRVLDGATAGDNDLPDGT